MNKDIVIACLKALGDENRIRMIMLLLEGELCVCQLEEVLGISQPLVSRHLSILKQAGLVTARREGKLMYYAVTRQGRSGGKLGLVHLLKNAMKEDALILQDRKRLKDCPSPHTAAGRSKAKR